MSTIKHKISILFTVFLKKNAKIICLKTYLEELSNNFALVFNGMDNWMFQFATEKTLIFSKLFRCVIFYSNFCHLRYFALLKQSFAVIWILKVVQSHF